MANGTDRVPGDASLGVLLLEDDPAVATGLGALLEHEGHQVRIASSTAEASTELAHFVPDVIVVDIHLSEESGVEYCRVLRERGATHPIVFISGHADAETIAALEWTTTGFLRKPFDFEDLLALIERVVRAGHRLRPSE